MDDHWHYSDERWDGSFLTFANHFKTVIPGSGLKSGISTKAYSDVRVGYIKKNSDNDANKWWGEVAKVTIGVFPLEALEF